MFLHIKTGDGYAYMFEGEYFNWKLGAKDGPWCDDWFAFKPNFHIEMDEDLKKCSDEHKEYIYISGGPDDNISIVCYKQWGSTLDNDHGIWLMNNHGKTISRIF